MEYIPDNIIPMSIRFKTHIATILILTAVTFSCHASSLDTYRASHQEEYDKAYSIYKTTLEYAQNNGYENAEFVLSFVFPEIMHYSAYTDKLESLFTNLCYSMSEYMRGYSIGYFQMKTIFAETVEEEIAKNDSLKAKYPRIDFGAKRKTIDDRKKRIERMHNLDTALDYLFAFVDICIPWYELQNVTNAEKLRIIATAYNAGLTKNRDITIKRTMRNTYPAGAGNPKSKWNYAQLCIDFWNERTK